MAAESTLVPIDEAPAVVVGPIELWPSEWALRDEGVLVPLTRRECEVLHVLIARVGHVVARERIYRHVWGEPVPVHNDRSVDVHVARLRHKLEQVAPGWECIHTHFGIGYRFEPVGPSRTHGRQA